MAELLKTTFIGFLREDEGSTPVLQTRTQTNMADPLITELEVRRALDGLNSHLFPKFLKAHNSHISPVLARLHNCSGTLAFSLRLLWMRIFEFDRSLVSQLSTGCISSP